MKRWTALLLMAVVLLWLCACGAPAEILNPASVPKGEGRTGEEDKTTSITGNPAQDTGSANGDTDPGNGPAPDGVTETPAGSLSLLDSATGADYYHFDNSNTINARDLLYVDYSSQQEVFLCSNAACTHDTQNCTAVFLLDQFTYAASLFTWNGALYILNRDPDQDGAAIMGLSGGTVAETESTPAALYRANLDGTDRHKVYTFDANVTVEDFVLGDDTGLYFITKKLSTIFSDSNAYRVSTDRKLIRVDPAIGAETVVCSIDFGDDIDWDVIGCTGRLVILHGIDFGREISPEELHQGDRKQLYDSAEDVFAALDIDSGELREFFRIHSALRSYAMDDANLYFSCGESDDILAVDLRTGAQRVLCSLPGKLIHGILGDHLYCQGDEDRAFDFVDINTGAVSHSDLVQKTLGWSLEFLAETEDQVLTVYDGVGTPNGDGSYSNIQWKYALISKENLYAGRDKFLPIEMTETGGAGR